MYTHIRRHKVLLVGALSLVMTVTTAPLVLAREDDDRSSSTRTVEPSKRTDEATTSNHEDQVRAQQSERSANTTERNKKIEASTTEREQHKNLAREKLDNQKRAICDKRSEHINKIMEAVENRTQNHFARITKVYDMTRAFYESKNLAVTDYDALVASVESAKSTAEAATNTLKAVPDFSCDTDGPKADIQNFKNKRLDKIHAFGTYREAVKKLLGAVRAATQALESGDAKKEGNQ